MQTLQLAVNVLITVCGNRSVAGDWKRHRVVFGTCMVQTESFVHRC